MSVTRHEIGTNLYCKSEDVEVVEKTLSRVVDSHIHFTVDEFAALAEIVMCNDAPNDGYKTEVLESMLEQIAVKCLGYDSWLQAYHQL